MNELVLLLLEEGTIASARLLKIALALDLLASDMLFDERCVILAGPLRFEVAVCTCSKEAASFYQAEEGFQRDGLSGAIARQAWAPSRPQTYSRGSGLRYPAPGERSRHSSSGFGRCRREALRHNGASAQHRTCTEPAAKNTSLNRAGGARDVGEPQALISAYEVCGSMPQIDRVLGTWAWPSFLARERWRECVHARGYPPPLPISCAAIRPARRRFLRVDLDNRLVAASLETEWNAKLRALAEAEQNYERQRQADQFKISAAQREQVLALATDFPRLWNDPGTANRERQRMVRLMIEDITVRKSEQLKLDVRFRGGASETLTLPRPLSFCESHGQNSEMVAEMDRLLENYNYADTARLLNEKAFRTGDGLSLASIAVGYVRKAYGLKSRFEPLRERGMLTIAEIALGRIHRRSTAAKSRAKRRDTRGSGHTGLTTGPTRRHTHIKNLWVAHNNPARTRSERSIC